jgi:hypothetical protein
LVSIAVVARSAATKQSRSQAHQAGDYYRHPDPLDRPSGLFEQLRWLAEAGFTGVDCFWMSAGHAVYGGYTSGEVAKRPTLA